MKPANILIVDDERGIRDLLTSELAREGHAAAAAEDGRRALELLRAERFELMVSDLSMPGIDGLSLLREAQRLAPALEVILMTGYGTVETAVEAMKRGAYDFIQKPFALDEMLALVEKALEKAELRGEARRYARLCRELERRIRENQELQDRLIQSEKLATVGRLAAGVAHEINNPLAGILGSAELLLASAGLSAQQREDLEVIRHQGERCRAIVRDLLLFSRKRKTQKRLVSLASVVEPSLALARPALCSASVELEVAVPADLPPLWADPTQLEQVLLNLLTNARQAMADAPVRRLALRARSEAGRVVLRVEDSGCGIAPADLGKVFDPFFTTKEPGQGTGLGLSVSYGIIREHQGEIQVESEPGRGTAVIVSLPAAEAGRASELPDAAR